MDLNTGIRYGVIPKNDLFNCAEEFFENAEDMSYQSACEEIKNAINSLNLSDGAISDILEIAEQDFNDNWDSENSLMRYEKDGFIIESSNDDCDLFVVKSPFFTLAPLCSPCAPGACYLRDGIKECDTENGEVKAGSVGLETYCLPEEWFEEGKCTYK
ncbi:MAG: hypothetical protein PHU71_07050, partial [Candidatus Gracilibacteria bacterium]|nr:hypothetical protein [Candidatus Gracilibacteria bacterium]